MRRQIGLLSIVGFFGLLAAADAQTPTRTSTAGAASSTGHIRLVSSAKVNPTYASRGGEMGPCLGPERRVPLTIAQGQARYATGTRAVSFEGPVGPHGELEMRLHGCRRWRLPPIWRCASTAAEIDEHRRGTRHASAVVLLQLMISSGKSNREREARLIEPAALPRS